MMQHTVPHCRANFLECRKKSLGKTWKLLTTAICNIFQHSVLEQLIIGVLEIASADQVMHAQKVLLYNFPITAIDHWQKCAQKSSLANLLPLNTHTFLFKLRPRQFSELIQEKHSILAGDIPP